MAKKIIRLTESQLIDSIQKIVSEEKSKEQELDEQGFMDFVSNPTLAAAQYAKNNPETAQKILGAVTNPIGTAANYMGQYAQQNPGVVQSLINPMGYWGQKIQDRARETAQNLYGQPREGGSFMDMVRKAMQRFSNPAPSSFGGFATRMFKMFERSKNISNMMASVKNGVIVNPSSQFNGMKWVDYLTKFDVNTQELARAKAYNEIRKTMNEKTLKRAQSIMAAYNSVNQDGIIANPQSKMNGITWYDYLRIYKITPQEVEKAKELVSKITQTPQPENKATQPAQQQKIQKVKEKVDAVKQGKQLVPKTAKAGKGATTPKGAPTPKGKVDTTTKTSPTPQIPAPGTANVLPGGTVTTNQSSFAPGKAPADVQQQLQQAVGTGASIPAPSQETMAAVAAGQPQPPAQGFVGPTAPGSKNPAAPNFQLPDLSQIGR